MNNKTSLNSSVRKPAALAVIAAFALLTVVVLWPEPETQPLNAPNRDASEGMSMSADTHTGHEGHGAMQSPATHTADSHPLTQSAEVWSCSMHPHIKRDGPGQCPICGMDLVPVRQEPSSMEDNEPRRLTLSSAQHDRMRIATVPVERRYPTARLLKAQRQGFRQCALYALLRCLNDIGDTCQ